MTGQGEVERDRKGEGVREGLKSMAPSTRRGMAGDSGLLVAEVLLLPELSLATYSVAPSVCVFLMAGVVAGEATLLVGVPNWMRISLRLGHVTWLVRLRTYKTKLLDQLIVLCRL